MQPMYKPSIKSIHPQSTISSINPINMSTVTPDENVIAIKSKSKLNNIPLPLMRQPVELKKKRVDEFYDSSDDEEIVEVNPYEGITPIEPQKISENLIIKRLGNIRTEPEIRNQVPQSHQYLIKNNAIEGSFNPVTLKRATSNFVAPLRDPKTLLDAVPSRPNTQQNLINSLVPSFRGIKWSENITREELFFSTRANWVGEKNYSSKTFTMTNTSVAKHTKAFFLKDEQVKQKHKNYDLTCIEQMDDDALQKNNEKLEQASNKWKQFFKLAEDVKAKFADWKEIVFPDIRDIKSVKKRNEIFSLAQILSYFYVNDYSKFKQAFANLPSYLTAMGVNLPEIVPLIKHFNAMNLTWDDLQEGIPYLSEGQIPRHALLYAFGLKCYTRDNELLIKPLYENGFKPERNKVYLGKLLVANNPHTLFSGADKAKYIPNYGSIISPMIIGEMEIQHPGANLQGTIAKHINIKLPKFHHDIAPSRYEKKYGLHQSLYTQFKATFLFLINNDEYGKLSWMYLESVLLAHLVHFHEIQLLKYSNRIAEDSNKVINWSNRDGSPISNPF